MEAAGGMGVLIKNHPALARELQLDALNPEDAIRVRSELRRLKEEK